MDISKLTAKELFNELQIKIQENEALKQEVNQLNISLLEVNEKLNEAEALKSHFISNISNEIVNPFTSILGLTENILTVDKENWKKVITMVSLVHSEVFNLDFQLRNIFTAAKLESGEVYPDVSVFNINKLIVDLIDQFKYELRHKNLKVNFLGPKEAEDNPVYFKSDAQKIHLLICNLLSNAIKFSYEKGSIVITAKKKNNKLTIVVQDFGQGISKTNEQVIYDRFKRLDSGINSINRGHGLGLSIIKALVDILEGQISFISDLGKGTTFTITIIESTKETFGTSVDADEILFNEDKF